MKAEKQREWRKENGFCTQCGEKLPDWCTFTTCDGCRAFRMLNYKARKKNNECVSCGKEDGFTMNGRALCADCAAKMAEREKSQRAAGADWSKKDILKKGTRLFCVIPAEPGEHGAYVCEDICLKRSDGMVYIKDGEFPVGYIGKSWFLNRAEAEKAMEASKSD